MTDTCDHCDQPATTQVTIGIAYGLYCARHGAHAEQARLRLIDQRNRQAISQATRRAARTGTRP